MTIKQVNLNQLVIDESIYPRNDINIKRVELFAENLRDGFRFDAIEVETHPDDKDKYRILDGAHRFKAHRAAGYTEMSVNIQKLDGYNALLYSASKAIGPQQLTEEEARETARHAYSDDTTLKPVDIGKAIGRSRRTVDSYIANLKTVNELELEVNFIRMKRLGLPIDRIVKRLNTPKRTLHNKNSILTELLEPIMNDISKGFAVPQIADKYSFTEPMIWSIVLEGKDDIDRFKRLCQIIDLNLHLFPQCKRRKQLVLLESFSYDLIFFC
ncbi:transcriptional regulator, ParBC family [Candidatus Magnetomorum sp. HK-1]|nr:transcriptional regulator, ParBC family [Candidatus Magnetomorum sp. HK-1]